MWLQGHPAGIGGKIWGGVRLYSDDQRVPLFHAITRFVRDYPDAKAAVIPTFQYVRRIPSWRRAGLLTAYYRFGLPGNLLNKVTGPIFFFFYDAPTPPPGLFADFNEIPHLFSDTATKTPWELSQETGGGDAVGLGASFRATTLPNLPEQQMVEYFEKYWEETYNATFAQQFADMNVQVTGFDPQPMSVRIAEASQRQGGNAIGLDPKFGDRIWIENNQLWFGTKCNEKCPAQSKYVSDKLVDYLKSRYKGIPCTNYQGGAPLDYVKYAVPSLSVTSMMMAD